MKGPVLDAILWLGPALTPLVALLLLPAGPRLRALVPFAALPALLVAMFAPAGTVNLPWLLLGARFGLDDTGRIFLLFTASLWLAAGIHGWSYLRDDTRRTAFFGFFAAAMAGNIGVILAQDAASFYVFFALMSFAAYGLVVHSCASDALHAGRVYIALVIAGELALFAAIVLWAHLAGSIYFADFQTAAASATAKPARNWAIGLTIVAFGIKAGAIPLHVWLPLAHPAAPTPASAILSGAMIKAGLLGWLRFLPYGSEVGRWGELMIAFGLFAAFAGALAGLLQRNPKSALAYSSISQMGFITVLVGTALAVPAAAPAATLAAAFYAFHHAFAKALLFLGVSMSGARSRAGRVAVTVGMALPALALAGAPLTSGAFGKAELKSVMAAAGWAGLAFPLSLAAVGTTLVMLRTLDLVHRTRDAHAPGIGMWAGWGLLVAGCAFATWIPLHARIEFSVLPSAWVGALVSALWPILAGLGLAAASWHAGWSDDRLSVPPGDFLVPLLRASERLRFGFPVRLEAPWAWRVSDVTALKFRGAPSRAEAALARRAGIVLLLMAAGVAVLAKH